MAKKKRLLIFEFSCELSLVWTAEMDVKRGADLQGVEDGANRSGNR